MTDGQGHRAGHAARRRAGRTIRAASAALGAVGLVALAAGCGSGGDSTAATTTRAPRTTLSPSQVDIDPGEGLAVERRSGSTEPGGPDRGGAGGGGGAGAGAGGGGGGRVTTTEAPALPATDGPNLLGNASFEDDGGFVRLPEAWEMSSPNGDEKSAAFVGQYGGGHDGPSHLTHFAKAEPFDVTATQTVQVPNGRYVAWVWAKSGGELTSATLVVTATGSPDATTSIVKPGDWHLFALEPFTVSSGKATVVIHTVGGANGWVYVDDVHLHRAP